MLLKQVRLKSLRNKLKLAGGRILKALPILAAYLTVSMLAFRAGFLWLRQPYHFAWWHLLVWVMVGGVFWYLTWIPERDKNA